LIREWAVKRQELKERTVKLIEDQVEETSQRLKSEFEQGRMLRVKAEKHERLED
jgi:dihydroneopterin aldolase